MVEVNPSLHCNQMCDNFELYIKLKLWIFSSICFYSHSQIMLYSQIVNLKVIFHLYFFLLTQLTWYSIKMNKIFRTCTEDLNAGKHVSDL